MATITERNGTYRITVSCGYDASGKQVRRSTTWQPEKKMSDTQLKKALAAKESEFEKLCRSSGGVFNHIKFEPFAKQWFKEYAEPRLKVRTIDCYRQFTVRVFQAMGHLYIDKISTRDMQLFINNLSEQGINERTGGGLAPKSVKNYLSFVSSVFDYALKQGMIEKNPCKNVSLPSIPQVERDCYTKEEAQQFLEHLETEPFHWRVFFTLAIYGGFRRGELFGLEWKDIDFAESVIHIRRSSLYTKEKGVFTDTPKTRSSQRSLKMPLVVMDLLKDYQAEQNQTRLQLGSQWVDCDRLFTAWNGAPMHPNSAADWLERFCKRAGMRKVNIHSFRHLNASLLISNHADIKTVSAALGHTMTSTTLNIYAHTFAEEQAKLSTAIADSLDFSNISKINSK